MHLILLNFHMMVRIYGHNEWIDSSRRDGLKKIKSKSISK